jgi:DNA-binding NtrC family response regulator
MDRAEESIHVLLVDDEVDFLNISRRCLEMEGVFQIDTALSVDEAAEKLNKETFDVIV